VPPSFSLQRAQTTLFVFVGGLALVCGCGERGRAGSADGDSKPKSESKSKSSRAEAGVEGQDKLEVSPGAAAIADAVDPARYRSEVEFIAQERPYASEHWQRVQDRCAAAFESAGFTVERQVFEGEGEGEGGISGVNVVGRKPGTDSEAATIVVGAHYDHIEDCPGADDNASGTAAVIELARVLGGEQRWGPELVVACWDREESGLHGSRAWVDRAVDTGERIGLYLNFDAMAFASDEPDSQRMPPGVELLFSEELAQLEANEYRADFIAVLADSDAEQATALVALHAARVGLPAMPLSIPAGLKNQAALADLRRSDHANFWHHDIPTVFLSDTAEFRTDTYHCLVRPDTVETLDFSFATKVVRTSAGALAQLLGA